MKTNAVTTPAAIMESTATTETAVSTDQRDAAAVVQHLRDLVVVLPQCPSLLKGKVRHIKVERFYRERRVKTWATPNYPIETCKINLTGHWIAETGLTADQRIQVIPLEHMLIIIPET